MLREASIELRFASETLRAEARELVATSRDANRRAKEALQARRNGQRLSWKPTG